MFLTTQYGLNQRLPWQLFEKEDEDQCILVVLASLQLNAIVLMQPNGDPTGLTTMPPQGMIIEHESLGQAGRRKTTEAIVSLKRPSASAPFRVGWHKGSYLGSAANPFARGRGPKMLHCVVFPVLYHSLEINANEWRSAFWVFEPHILLALLEPTRLGNPIKYGIINQALVETQRQGFIV